MSGAASVLALLFLAAFAAASRADEPPPFDMRSVDSVLANRSAALDSLLMPESIALDTAGVDSIAMLLDAGGFAAARAHTPEWRGPRGARISLHPLAHSTYNRVEGFRAGAGMGAELARSLALDGFAGYETSNHRWVGGAGLSLGRKTRGPALRVEGGVDVVPFGSEPQRANAALALVAGQDRADYLETRGGRVTIWPRRSRGSQIALAYFDREERSVPAATDFSLLDGGDPIEAPNPAIDEGRTRDVSIRSDVTARSGVVTLGGEAGVAGGGLGGDFGYSWQRARLALRPILPGGGVLTLAVEGAHAGGSPPAQSGPHLGGDANLRGYDRLQFAGRSRASARVEYAEGPDLIPALHVRFIPFVDVGTTWGEAAGVARARGGLDGAIRSSFGLGIERRVWIPTIESARLDIIHRNDGAGDPWSVWFRLEGLEW